MGGPASGAFGSRHARAGESPTVTSIPPRRATPEEDTFFDVTVVRDEDGGFITHQRFFGFHTTRDLVQTLAIVTGHRSDELLVTHKGTVLGAGDARLLRVFCSDLESAGDPVDDNGH